MAEMATTSNPNAKVPGVSPGGTPPGTVPNMGAGYKLPSVVVIDPDANPTYGQSKAINAQITGAGTGGTGTDVIVPSPVVQISSVGLAQTLGVAPGSYVPSGTTVTPATSQNSLVVAAPKASTVNTSTDNYYSFASNGKTVNVLSSQYDSWTPQQQFAYQQSQGLLPKGAQISFNADGSWGYTTPAGSSGNAAPASTVLAKYTDKDGNVNLAAALAGGVTADFLAQQGFTQPQISQAKNYNSVMTQLKPYASGSGYNIQQALADGKITVSQLQSVGFSSSVINQAETNNSIMRILNNPKNGIKTTDGYDIAKALANKNVTAADLQAVGFSAQVISQAETSNAIMAILNNPKNDLSDGKGGYYLAKALSSGKVTNADLLTAGFTQAQITAAMVPVKTIPTTNTSAKSAVTKVAGKTTASTTTAKSSVAKTVLSIVGNNLKPNYSQSELKSMYENFNPATAKDIESALIAVGNPDTYLGAKISAVGKLFTLLTSTNPVVKLKNGQYALLSKGEVDISDNPAAVAAETAESATDWDKVLDGVNEASQGARDQGINLGNMLMRTNEGITQMSPNGYLYFRFRSKSNKN
jgi:hypothetical protein